MDQAAMSDAGGCRSLFESSLSPRFAIVASGSIDSTSPRARGSQESGVRSPESGDLTICYLLFAICDSAILRFGICWQLERKIANIKSQIENIKSPDSGLR